MHLPSMLRCYGGCALLPLPPNDDIDHAISMTAGFCSSINKAPQLCSQAVASTQCWARRRVIRYNDEDEDEDEKEEYGHNADIAMLELYSQSARDEVLLVKATVDGQEAEVLIFKGFSSCLSYRTSPDPSRSVLPARAVVKSIDRIKGPFDPSNIEYVERGVTWETFKSRFNSN